MEEEVEILRASESAGIPILIMESLDESLYRKRKKKKKHSENIPFTINSGYCGIDSPVFQA